MNPSQLRDTLSRHGLHLSRDLGQNFLVDDELARRLAQLAGVQPTETVVEIGTGLGTLTRALAERAQRVVTIEVDAGLVRALKADDLLPANTELVHGDAMKLDLPALVADSAVPVRVVANLPYSAASPLLLRLLDLRHQLEGWSVMLQRELARRLIAQVGSRDYGSLSVLHQLTVDVFNAMELSPRCFFPAPKVHSSFLCVTPRADAEITQEELAGFERVARAAFNQRRKTLVNSLLGSGGATRLDRADLETVLRELGVEPRARAESLAPELLLALYRSLDSR